MSRTQYFCAASLDGFIAESDDTLEWLTKYDGSFNGAGAEPMKGTYERFYDGVGALVMGSTTYEFVLAELGEWPYQGKPTWILTSRELPEPAGEDVDVRIGKGNVSELFDACSPPQGSATYGSSAGETWPRSSPTRGCSMM
jgi:dihydrofolate reductase